MRLSSLALVLVLAAPAPLAAQAETPSTVSTESPKGSATPGPTNLEVPWKTTLADGVAEARKRPGQRLFVSLTAEECGNCERMDHLILPSLSFLAMLKDKTPVLLDIASPDGRALAERFGIPQAPAWFILTPDLLLCGMQAGATSQSKWFQTFVDTERAWAGYKKKLADEKKAPSDRELVFDVAVETYQRGDLEKAEPRFRRLSSDKQAPGPVREGSLAYLGAILMDTNRIEDAAKTLETLRTTAKDPNLKERAELRLADVELARGRRDRAKHRLEEFKKAHPASPRIQEADELLAAIAKAAAGATEKPR